MNCKCDDCIHNEICKLRPHESDPPAMRDKSGCEHYVKDGDKKC